MASDEPQTSRPKPTVRQLGLDLASLDWQRSGAGDGSFEVAFVWSAEHGAAPGVSDHDPPASASESGQATPMGATPPEPGENGSRGPAGTGAGAAEFVLLRVAGDRSGRVLVYDPAEWRYFVDGARGGEFDAAPPAGEQVEPGCGSGASQRDGPHGR